MSLINWIKKVRGMIFEKSSINPMHDILMLWGNDWETITIEKIDKFKLLLKAGGFVAEDEKELSGALISLEEIGVIELNLTENPPQIRRKILYG